MSIPTFTRVCIGELDNASRPLHGADKGRIHVWFNDCEGGVAWTDWRWLGSSPW